MSFYCVITEPQLLVNHHLLHYTLAAHTVLNALFATGGSTFRVGNVTISLSMHFAQH